MVVTPAIGARTVPVQAIDNGEVQILSFISHDFTETVRKIALIFEKLIVHDIVTHEFSINGSKHPSTSFTDHKATSDSLSGGQKTSPPFGCPYVFTRLPKFVFFYYGIETLLLICQADTSQQTIMNTKKKIKKQLNNQSSFIPLTLEFQPKVIKLNL